MALITISARKLIVVFRSVAVLTDKAVMHACQLIACLLLVVEIPRIPVRLRMAGGALSLELALMDIIMAIHALLVVCFIALGLVALRAVR